MPSALSELQLRQTEPEKKHSSWPTDPWPPTLDPEQRTASQDVGGIVNVCAGDFTETTSDHGQEVKMNLTGLNPSRKE